jgi:carbonic anhydrase
MNDSTSSWRLWFDTQLGPMIEPIVPAALAVKSDSGDFVDNTAKAASSARGR